MRLELFSFSFDTLSSSTTEQPIFRLSHVAFFTIQIDICCSIFSWLGFTTLSTFLGQKGRGGGGGIRKIPTGAGTEWLAMALSADGKHHTHTDTHLFHLIIQCLGAADYPHVGKLLGLAKVLGSWGRMDGWTGTWSLLFCLCLWKGYAGGWSWDYEDRLIGILFMLSDETCRCAKFSKPVRWHCP